MQDLVRPATHRLLAHLALHLRRSLTMRPATLVLALALALATIAGTNRGAHAQGAAQMVGGPLTTARFERLLRAYVQPTTTEATALDRLHEAYLERFRAELDPELEQLANSMGGGMPSLQEFRKFLREIERLQSRIAQADAALLASCAELVAEERRAGFTRIRDARERQRALAGLTRMGSQVFGGGGSFVDLADLATRQRVLAAVPDEQRARFDAFLATQEARTLVQARSLDRATAKALDGFYESMLAMQSDAIAAAERAATEGAGAEGAQQPPDPMARQLELMRSLGDEPRKIVAANFTANRTALSDLASVLPTPVLDELRVEMADRAIGSMRMFMFQGGVPMDDVSPAVVAARMRRDRLLDADALAQARAIVATWRHDHADATERLAATLLDAGAGNFLTKRMMGTNPDPADEAERRVDAALAAARTAVDDAAQKAHRALAALGDGRGHTYFTASEEGGRSTLRASEWKRAPDARQPGVREIDDDAPKVGRASTLGSLARGQPAVAMIQLSEILSQLALVGIDTSSAATAADTIEAVHAAWATRVYHPTVTPLHTQSNELMQKLWSRTPEGAYTRDEAANAAFAALVPRLRDAYLAAEEALLADLAGALGLAADGPELTALRLERLAALAGDEQPFGESTTRLVTPLQALGRARLAPEAGRALFADSIDAWRALLSELPTREAARADAARDLERLQASMSDPARQTDAAALAEQSTRAWMRVTGLVRDDAGRVRAAFDAAAAALSSNGRDDDATRLRLAARQLMYPELHRAADTASPLLERTLAAVSAATAAPRATDDQIARLEALKAEYDAVFESLTLRMIELSGTAPGDADFRAQMRHQETIEKLRFQRDERTTKARSEARRILGDTLAATVPGLVPDEDELLLAERPSDTMRQLLLGNGNEHDAE